MDLLRRQLKVSPKLLRRLQGIICVPQTESITGPAAQYVALYWAAGVEARKGLSDSE